MSHAGSSRHEPIEVDQSSNASNLWDNNDDMSVYTASLTSSVVDYKWNHGRRFHSYHSGKYNFPNDEREQERLDMFHHIILDVCGGRHFLAPIEPHGMRILDIGTGTGLWAIEMGDLYPTAEIHGNDLSPIQPNQCPPNVSFTVDDVEEEWAETRPYDYIHCRYMAGAIKDWPRLIRQCFENLKPGGWVEFQDVDTRLYSEDNTIGPDNKVREMLDLLRHACDRIGRTLDPGPQLEGWVRDAGFQNVRHRRFPLPIGTWPKDRRMKRIGAMMALQHLDGVEAFTMEPFTEILGWSREEVKSFNAKVRQDVQKKGCHMIHDFHVVYAQKPAPPEAG
ncbi:S-adenosyl-L-methionine-dependent methyltransferase [Thermoascus aurantiacus ATCC 26904]